MSTSWRSSHTVQSSFSFHPRLFGFFKTLPTLVRKFGHVHGVCFHSQTRRNLQRSNIQPSNNCPFVVPQQITAPITRAAIFLVSSISESPDAISRIHSTFSSLEGLAKNIAIRDQTANFAWTVAIGSTAWDRLTSRPRPPELHPLPVFKGRIHSTVSTPGDLLFHIRADRVDLCFEFERQVLSALGPAVHTVDETRGFRYFDARNLLGFVDGTANPVGEPAVSDAALVQPEDVGASAAATQSVGGSYVVVQKYVHDLTAWDGLSTEQQETIIGRTKLDNLELDDAGAAIQKAHKTLATIKDEAGEEHSILRDNMPFGSPATGEYGTYFVGYSRRL